MTRAQQHREGARIGAARFLLATVGLGSLLIGCPVKPPREDPSPIARSVVLLVIDTLPASTLGCYGNPRNTSPEIDRLAQGGALFKRVYAPSNWTMPSTASLLTSLYPSEHGAEVTGEPRALSGKNPPKRLDPSIETLAEILNENGIKTGLFSANPYLGAGLQQGYQVAEVERMSATALNDLAIDWLETLSTEPFFLHLQYMDLHLPVEPPAEFATLFADQGDDMEDPRLANWAYQKGANAVGDEFEDYKRRKIALNDGAARYVDSEIERLLKVLEDRGLLSDTLVVVTSDHGEEFWQHVAEEFEMGGDPRDVYGIGHGHAMYEEIVRVPLLFNGPGVAAGDQHELPWSLLDVAPTLLDSFGIEPPTSMNGKSLLPILQDEGGSQEMWDSHLIESPAYGPDSSALVSENYKFVSRADGIELLFDLEKDPEERKNLAESQPGEVARFRKRLTAMKAAMVAAPEADTLVADEDTTEQLRALGYVE